MVMKDATPHLSSKIKHWIILFLAGYIGFSTLEVELFYNIIMHTHKTKDMCHSTAAKRKDGQMQLICHISEVLLVQIK